MYDSSTHNNYFLICFNDVDLARNDRDDCDARMHASQPSDEDRSCTNIWFHDRSALVRTLFNFG